MISSVIGCYNLVVAIKTDGAAGVLNALGGIFLQRGSPVVPELAETGRYQ
jgi:hypothetical protein